MTQYRVSLEITVEAEDPQQAALEAYKQLATEELPLTYSVKDPASSATDVTLKRDEADEYAGIDMPPLGFMG
jgi:hypothetical protein